MSVKKSILVMLLFYCNWSVPFESQNTTEHFSQSLVERKKLKKKKKNPCEYYCPWRARSAFWPAECNSTNTSILCRLATIFCRPGKLASDRQAVFKWEGIAVFSVVAVVVVTRKPCSTISLLQVLWKWECCSTTSPPDEIMMNVWPLPVSPHNR